MSHDEGTTMMLNLYQEVARLSGNMLSAAHQNDWDKMLELEAGCASCIESLKSCPVPEELNAAARQQKVELLKMILANDREIRKLTDPWMQRIGHLLESTARHCDVARAYQSE